jgi:hypothetical protein
MPKIRRARQSQVLSQRSGSKLGFGQNTGREARAISGLGSAIEKNVGGVAMKLQDMSDTVETQELSNEFQTQISQAKSREEYDAAFTSISEKASNGKVRNSLRGFSERAGAAFNSKMLNQAADEKLRDLGTSADKSNNMSAGRLLLSDAQDRDAMLLSERESGKALSEKLKADGGAELGEAVDKSNLKKLRAAYIESGNTDPESAERILAGVMGKSENEDVNNIFNDMDPSARAQAIKSLQSTVGRRSSESKSRTSSLVAEMTATNTLNRTISPQLAAAAIGEAMKIKDPQDKKLALDRVNFESSFNVMVAKNSSGKSMGDIVEDLRFFERKWAKSSKDTIDIRNKAEKFLQNEQKLRREDPKTAADRIASVERKRVDAINGGPVEKAQYFSHLTNTQSAMGMRRSVIGKDDAEAMASVLNSSGGLEARASFIDSQLDSFGDHKFIAMNDLKNHKVISGPTLSYAFMTTPASKQKVLQNESLLKDGTLSDKNLSQVGFSNSKINKAVKSKMSDYRKSASNNPGLLELMDQIESQVVVDAKSRGVQGSSSNENDAVKEAVALMVEPNFIKHSPGSSRVFSPRFPGYNEDRTESFLSLADEVDSLKKFDIDFNKSEFKDADEFLDQNEDNFFWMTDPRDTNRVRLFMATSVNPVSVTSGGADVSVDLRDISNGTSVLSEDIDSDIAPFSRFFIAGPQKAESQANIRSIRGGR